MCLYLAAGGATNTLFLCWGRVVLVVVEEEEEEEEEEDASCSEGSAEALSIDDTEEVEDDALRSDTLPLDPPVTKNGSERVTLLDVAFTPPSH
jgi:hypothetical protein